MDRRSFLVAAGAVAGSTLTSCAGTQLASGSIEGGRPGPLLIGTWPFGQKGCDRGLEVMQAGGSALDGVEQGVRLIETIGNSTVGLSGTPNAAGYVQVDACIMDGPGHRAGSVAGVEGIVHPITAARRVMEKSKHVMLVGDGARWFAKEHGVESVGIEEHAAMKKAWEERDRSSPTPPTTGHDTIAILALGADGHVAGACSTSGAGGKLPGRVGDSPILGSGLYVDNEVGAVGATGLGENIMRHCAAVRIVDRMRAGYAPAEACAEVIHDMAKVDPKGYELAACFIALDVHGRFGAAASNQRFPFAVAMPGRSEILRVEAVEKRG